MPELRLNAYPKDGTPHHLYVNFTFEQKAAEMDLRTGRITVSMPEHASEAASMLAEWCIRNPHLVAAARARNERPTLPPTDDYATNAPGQNLRVPEREAREAERRRSVAWSRIATLFRLDAGRDFRAGIAGEQRIARVLARLSRRSAWRVLHSIPLTGGGDIDHLLIGTDGVVAINSKHHHKARISLSANGLWVNGARTDHVQNAREQAKRVSAILSAACGFEVRVHGCVAIFNRGLNAPELSVSGRPADVLVATNWNLPRVLWHIEDGLLDEQVDAIYEAARRPATWAKRPDANRPA